MQVELAEDRGLLHHELHFLSGELLSLFLLLGLVFLHPLHLYLVVSAQLIFGIAALEVYLDLESARVDLLGLLHFLKALPVLLLDLAGDCHRLAEGHRGLELEVGG